MWGGYYDNEIDEIKNDFCHVKMDPKVVSEVLPIKIVLFHNYK